MKLPSTLTQSKGSGMASKAESFKATILDDGGYEVAVIEADDSQKLGEEIGSEIHLQFVGGWNPSSLAIEFERGGDGHHA